MATKQGTKNAPKNLLPLLGGPIDDVDVGSQMWCHVVVIVVVDVW